VGGPVYQHVRREGSGGIRREDSGAVHIQREGNMASALGYPVPTLRKKEFIIDNLLVRIYSITDMILVDRPSTLKPEPRTSERERVLY